jgi:predicted TIM-barrel fold metal-dependent hydrolase
MHAGDFDKKSINCAREGQGNRGLKCAGSDNEYNTYIMPLATGNLIAIDTHVHIESEAEGNAADQAARKYFGDTGVPRGRKELAEYYRSRNIGCVVFSVDERLTGRAQVSNDIVADFAEENSDIVMAFASVDPTRGPEALSEARRLIARGVKGFKLHPPLQQFHANDKVAYPFYEVMNEARMPVIFHTGHSGIGTGMPGGGGVRLKYGNPMDIDDVAVDFPDMTIIMAHPSFPWQDEAISVCLHKPQVYIDLSGWSPKYFSPVLIQYANTLLKKKMLFGSDFPLITPDRWLADFEKIAIKDEVRPLILKENAIRLFGLNPR